MADPLSAFTGSVIYMDTMLPYLLLRSIDESVKPLFKRIEAGELRAYTSVLTFDELAYRLLLAFIKDRYGGSALERLRDEEEKMLTEFAPQTSALLRQLSAYASLTVLDVLATDLSALDDAMVKYHLRPRDALHFAAMQRVGCLNLASNDPHFDRVPGIHRYTPYV